MRPPLAQLFELLADLLALLHKPRSLVLRLVKGLSDAPSDRLFSRPREVVANAGRKIFALLHLLRKRAQEGVGEFSAAIRDHLKPLGWKSLEGRLFAAPEHFLDPSVVAIFVGRDGHIGIEGEGGDLPKQNFLGRKENPGRAHLPGEHRRRVLPELKIVRAGVGDHHVQRVAVAPPASAHPLNVVRLLRRNRAQQKGGEIANVDSHLQGRRG